MTETDPQKLTKQISVAYKGLQQLRQYDEPNMTASNSSNDWTVTLEQNPMPKPADYDERKQKEKEKAKKRAKGHFGKNHG